MLSNGYVEQLDSPHKLLQTTEGLFSEMVSQTGDENRRQLQKIAEEKHKKKVHSVNSVTTCKGQARKLAWNVTYAKGISRISFYLPD